MTLIIVRSASTDYVGYATIAHPNTSNTSGPLNPLNRASNRAPTMLGVLGVYNYCTLTLAVVRFDDESRFEVESYYADYVRYVQVVHP